MFKFFKSAQSSKIQNRLVRYYIIFAVFTVSLVTYLTYTQAAQSLRLTVEDKLNTVAALKIDSLNQWVDEQQSAAIFLASLPELRALSGMLLNPESSQRDRASAHDNLTRLITLIAQRASDYRDIQVLDLNGKIIVSVSPGYVGSSQANQPFFQEGQKKTFIQNFYESDLFGSTTLTISTPLFDSGNKRVGVLALHFNMKRVDDIVWENQQLNEAIQSFLINPSRRMITSDPIILSESPTKESFAINAALGGGEGNASYINHTGIPVIGRYQWIKERNVALIVEINEATALLPARDLAFNVATIGILFTIVLVVIVTVLAQRITAPLLALTRTVTHISEGDLNASAPVLSDDEVGTLAQAFNAMTAKLRQTLAGLETELHERKQAEEALAESEKKFRMLAENTPVVVYQCRNDERFTFIYLNDAVEDLTGYPKKAFLEEGFTFFDLYHPDDVHLIALPEDKLHLHKPSFHITYRIRHKSGEWRWVNEWGTYVTNETDHIEYIVGMIIDITERIQTENDLRDSEQRFRTVFESSPIAICITTLEDGRMLEANYAYWDLMGYDPKASIGKTAEELKLWDTPEERAEFVQNLKTRGSLYNPDDSFLDLNGKRRDVISFYRLVHIGGEERVISMFYDMSAQKQTMQALLQSEARVRALLEAIPDMIFELSWDGLIVNAIPPKGVEESMPIRNFIGKHVRDVLSEPAVSQTLLSIKRSLATNRINMFEFEEKMGKEIRAMEARIVPSSATTTIMMIRDITQRKWIETEREKFIRELEVKNRESETLRESLASIVTIFDIEMVMERILDQIKQVIPYDTASVWRVDGEWQTLMIGRDLPPEIPPESLKFKVDENNSSRPILYGGKSFVLCNNVQDELSDFKGPHSYVNSWLAVPLRTRGRVIGLIALDGRQKNQFNEHHAELAVTFAAQAAIALENAVLFANLQSELEKTRELIEELQVKNVEVETMRESLASIVGTFEFSEIIQRILDQIQLVVPYDSASIWRLDDNWQILVGQRGVPSEIAAESFALELDEQNHAMRIFSGELSYIISEDVQANSEFFRFHEPPHTYINSWLGVPLKVRGKITGLIALDGKRKSQFNEHHAELAVTFADQVSIALENARLFSDLQSELSARQALIRELEQRNAEAETLRESTAIVAATLEISETVNRILEQIKRVVQYDSASVWLYEGEYAFLMGSNGLPPGAELPGKYVISESEPDYAFWMDEVPYILLDDIQEQYPDFRNPPKNYIHGWLTIPLRVRGKLTGLISLDSRTPGKFTEHDAELALTFASQVSIAMENARLFSDLQAELTARKDLIAELESKNAELERFTYTVSHDLKSPLFTIRGFLGYLERDALTGNHARMKSDMQRIADATEKMQQLLNDLLELSRIGRLMNEPAYVPFEELAREAVSLVQGRIMDRGVAVHIDANMPVVYGDRQRLLEVVQNLVDNAAKFMGDQTDPRIEIGWDGHENGKPIFHVRDNGIGISPEHHERIFGLFNKLDVKVDGTGIGLALVKRIVEVHGGRIWVESEAGKGTAFYFTLAGTG